MSEQKNAPSLEAKRHSLAHILAQAVLDMFPEAKLGVGPAIENGFYYDFELPRTLIPEDLPILEKKMKHIVKQNQQFTSEMKPADDAIAYLKEINQPYKVELAAGFKEDGYDELGFHRNGPFVDLCRGGHIESTNQVPIGTFKLDKIAGAYWKGDETRPMLQRIYGLAFETKEDLEAHLKMLKEAEKRDHRKLGKQLDLFTFSELVGPGLPLWTPRGTLMRHLLDEFVWELRRARGYERVTIPHITKKELYETSGHWAKYKDDLFRVSTREGHEFGMKPMNCPHHTQIYAHLQRSYKDLPQRYAETTMIYRDEQTGELHGLSRVRSITQDDAHVFCRPSQVKEEFLKIWDIIEIFYKTTGFGNLKVRLSLHEPDKFEKYLGTPELWQGAEDSLREIAQEKGVDYVEAPGEAAFYGPKVDFMAKDSIGREWQVATIQLDINMPQRFDLFCIDENGEQERIVMVHAAIMGSLERFMAVFIEHHAGAFPTWIAPVQVALVPVATAHEEYAKKLKEALDVANIRVDLMTAEDSLGKRIRTAEKQKIPYMLVLGDKEQGESSVTVRCYGKQEQETVKFEKFLDELKVEICERRLNS